MAGPSTGTHPGLSPGADKHGTGLARAADGALAGRLRDERGDRVVS